MERFSAEITSSSSKALALLGLFIAGLEAVIAEYGCARAGVSAYPRDALGTTVRIHCVGGEGPIDQLFDFEEAIKSGLIEGVEVSSEPPPVSLHSLYSTVPKEIGKYAASALSSYALRTALEGVEYMVVVLRNGRAALLEGEVEKVRIPYLRHVADAHTHPRWCFPSAPDIESLMNLLLDSGLGSAIVSPECTLVMAREGPFTEEDYLALAELRNSVRGGDYDPLKEAVSVGRVGENVTIRYA
jgi:hypothetical protein